MTNKQAIELLECARLNPHYAKQALGSQPCISAIGKALQAMYARERISKMQGFQYEGPSVVKANDDGAITIVYENTEVVYAPFHTQATRELNTASVV